MELSNDEGYVDILERGFDAGIRLGFTWTTPAEGNSQPS